MSFVEADMQTALAAHYRAVHARLYGPPRAPAFKRPAYKTISNIPLPPTPLTAFPGPQHDAHMTARLADLWRRMDRDRSPKHVSISAVIKVTAAYYGVTQALLKSRNRSPRVCRMRHAAIHLARELGGRSFLEIGKQFQRESTTVHHVNRTAAMLIAADPAYAAEVDDIRALLAREGTQ